MIPYVKLFAIIPAACQQQIFSFFATFSLSFLKPYQKVFPSVADLAQLDSFK